MRIKTDMKWSNMTGMGPFAWDRDENPIEVPLAHHHHHEEEGHHAPKKKPGKTKNSNSSLAPKPDGG